MTTILRIQGVIKRRGKSRSSHYCDILEGLFTEPVKIGARSSGWPEHEVDTLNAARIAGKSDAEIRELVLTLMAARKSAS
jgi:prophage regulatory protein